MDGSDSHLESLSGLTLQLLGPPVIRLNGAELLLGRRKVIALLVYLTVTARRQSRDTLTDLLYPLKDKSRAGADFRQTLSVLAGKIGKNRLDITGSSILLRPTPDMWVDTQVFRKLTAPIRQTGEVGTSSDPQSLTRAVQLYRSHFLSGFYLKDSPVFDDWQFFEQESLQREYASALRRLAELHQDRGELEAAIEWCHRLVALDALDETAHRRLMRLFTLAGQRNAALRQYDRCRSVLLKDLCEEPDVETERLYNQIRSGQLVSQEKHPSVLHPQRGRSVGSAPPLGLEPGKMVLLFADTGLKPRRDPRLGPLNRIVEAAQGTIVEDEDRYQVIFPTVSAAVRAAIDAQLLTQSKAAEQGSVERRGGLRMSVDVGRSERNNGGVLGPAAERAGLLLQAAHRGQILLSAAAAELAREALPERTDLRLLGAHRLSDLGPPQPIFQLLHPELIADFPSLKTIDSRPNNLPTQSTRLVGREKDLGMVSDLLKQDDVRALTLTGPAGTGKTRLALRVAAGLIDRFEQGIYFVDLAPLNSADMVIPTIALTLDLRDSRGQTTPLFEILKGFLRNRRILLLLDNFEHLLSAAAQVEELLLSCPALKVLITSREPLRISFERDFAVSTLCLPEEGIEWNLKRMNHYSAVRLFAERSISVQPDFRLSEENALTVADICLKLDGLPLAIELAVSCLRFLTLRDLRKKLSHRLILLKGGSHLPARHRTLRNAIEWSYTLLSDQDRELFAQLSVFKGGCTLEAAEEVSGGFSGDVLEGLRSLVEKSLLKQKDDNGVSRYWMLETIKEYARLCLEKSDEADACRQRHADYFLDLAVKTEPELRGPDQRQWFDRLGREHNNLNTALRWFLDHGRTKESLRMGSALFWHWFHGSNISVGKRWLQEALSLDLSTVPLDLKAKALYSLGFLLFLQGDWSHAKKLLQRSLALYRQSGERRGQSLTLSILGIVERWLGEKKRGNAHCLKGVRMAREEGDSLCIADSLIQAFGTTGGKFAGRAPRAELEEALRRSRQIGDLWGIAHGLNSLGDLFVEMGDYAQARIRYEESLYRFREQKNQWMTAWNLEGLGRVSRAEDNLSEAAAYTRDSLELFHQFRDRSNTLIMLSRLGTIARSQGDHRRSACLLGAFNTLSDASNSSRAEPPEELAPACSEYRTNYVREWTRGQALTLDQAVAYAVHDSDSSFGPEGSFL